VKLLWSQFAAVWEASGGAVGGEVNKGEDKREVQEVSSSGTDKPQGSRRRWVNALLFVLAMPLVVTVALVTSPRAASAANVVNETFQFPLSIQLNTCTTPVEPVATSGNLHIVVTTTSDNRGGYHVTVGSNTESVTGTGLISGEKYTSSTTNKDTYYAGAPFPQINTMIHNYELVSQSGTANLIMKITFHVTVDANGIPTAAVDNVQSGCQG
jgi:hypothetical protein